MKEYEMYEIHMIDLINMGMLMAGTVEIRATSAIHIGNISVKPMRGIYELYIGARSDALLPPLHSH
jgi:hypothetical protein